MPNLRWAVTAAVILIAACDSTTQSEDEASNPPALDSVPDIPSYPTVDEVLADELQTFWKPWHGGFEGMVERRVVRALTTYGGYQLYYEDGKPSGAIYDMLMELEDYLNEKLDRRHVRVHVLPIPVSRDQLIPALLAGHGDLIATDLTITPERQARIDFTRPLLIDVDEVVVHRADIEGIGDIQHLAGREVFVRASSSYFEHLKFLSGMFEENQLRPPILVAADELLEAEDIAEMISVGEAELTIMDDYKAQFWSEIMPNIVVRDDLSIASDGSIAWAHRKDSPALAEILDEFLKRYGRGSLFGNDTYNRHLKSATRARCATSSVRSDYIEQLISLFTKYGEMYSIDWLRLAAQAYQESGLRQSRKSHAGAVGIMQIKPSTAADRNVGIKDVTQLENNIHAGTKYLRFLADRYFSDDEFSEREQWLFSLAAYNAGPARVYRLRKEAAENGYDPAVWFDNVEIIAARRIGRETVTYVSNVFKYYVGYQLIAERQRLRGDRYGDLLVACNDSE